jgi:hypothetical protein
MTILDAIKSVVAYAHLSEDTFQRTLIDRGLEAATDYSGITKQFELATADIYKTLVTVPNVSEGDVQISLTDKSNFIKLANAIYTKYDEPVIDSKKAFEVPRGKAPTSW